MHKSGPESRIFRDTTGKVLGFTVGRVREDIEASLRDYNALYGLDIMMTDNEIDTALEALFDRAVVDREALREIVSGIIDRRKQEVSHTCPVCGASIALDRAVEWQKCPACGSGTFSCHTCDAGSIDACLSVKNCPLDNMIYDKTTGVFSPQDRGPQERSPQERGPGDKKRPLKIDAGNTIDSLKRN